MSGWVAVLNADGAPVDPGLLRTLLDVPPFDRDPHVWIEGPIGLASAPFRRKPHASYTETPRSLLVHDGLVVVFDGRLDDRAHLRTTLGDQAGGPLDWPDDIELATLAYRTWGPECARQLFGDFAVCIWDGVHRRLVGIRDRFGVKPFYIAQRGATLILSNVLRSVRRHPLVSDRLDDRSVGDMLLFALAMDPQRTMFADIGRLPPGHTVVHPERGVQRVDPYWAQLRRHGTLRYDDPRQGMWGFASALEHAVKERVRGGPIGVLMSGGLDSSSVAATAAIALGSSSPTMLRAFTGVYETVIEDDERHYSTLVATSLNIGIDHIPLDGYGFFDRWDNGGLPPEPTAEPMTAPTVDMLARAAHHGAAALTGDGGDPLLLPTSFVEQVGRVPFGRLMIELWASRRAAARPPLGIRSVLRRWTRRTSRETPPWLAPALSRKVDLRERRIEIDAQRTIDRGERSAAINALVDPWWPSTFETYDPGATGQPVEMRYPFFDWHVVHAALFLPSFPLCVNKYALREIMRGRLPDAVRLRPKTPLAVVPETFHGQWPVTAAVQVLESVPGIEQYIDVRKFASTVRPDAVFKDAAALAAVSLAKWLYCSSKAPAPTLTV